MDALDALENESVHVLREAYANFPDLAMLWSVGKDSTVLLWLARKAFFGHVPFPLVHVDTTKKLPEMITFRDRIAKEWGLRLIVGTNDAALEGGMGPERGRLQCCDALKTEGLKQVMERHRFSALILGIRRDEEGTRAKERFFSPRDSRFQWNFREQPPELWDQFQTTFPPGTHVRVHPLLSWREIDVWEYVARERIPLPSLYFAKNGQRYRSLGCAPCTGTVPSHAETVDEILVELRQTSTSERAGRAQDREDGQSLQKLRVRGYM